MGCLKSFNILISLQRGFSTAGTNIKNWGSAGNYHWQVIENTLGSDLNIQGFKRLDIYGIQMVGNVYTDLSSNDGGIISDYGFNLNLTGQSPLVSGQTIIGGYPLSTTSNNYYLSKYTNCVNFESPITGVTNINFGTFQAQGNNGETLNSLTLDLRLNFIFYYKYDGE